MSFLRALRAYVGLGPDDEIEDRYLSELNARRRQLALDEISPERRRRADGEVDEGYDLDLDLDDPLVDDDADETSHFGPERHRRNGPGRHLDHVDDPDDDVVVRPRSGGRDESRRTAANMVDEFEGFDPNDELDLAFIERLSAAGGGRSGRHDIEPDAALESIVDDDGVEAVRVRSREDEAELQGNGHVDRAARSSQEIRDAGGVVRSLDSMRAKPRTLMPESFADAKLVADEFKRDIPVVLNLQGVERDLARRLIDFASGICYVLDGSMEKIASQVFLLIPDSVEVSEEDRRLIEERGYAR